MFINTSLLMQILINSFSFLFVFGLVGYFCVFGAKQQCWLSAAVACAHVLPSVCVFSSSFVVLLCSVP